MAIQPFIPSLPDEISQECLFRVSYRSHEALKSVCKRWRYLLNESEYYPERKARGATEQLVCFVQVFRSGENVTNDIRDGTPAYGITVFDPLKETWERLPPLPGFEKGMPLYTQCVSLQHQLLLIGGWNPNDWEQMKTVFIYDFVAGKWRHGADMPTLRTFFACAAAADGIVYIAGGHDQNKNALRSAEIYDVHKNCWKRLPDMSYNRDECEGVFVDGRFIVVSGYATESQGRFLQTAEIYDPKSGVWKTVDNFWSSGECPRSYLASDGNHLFCISGKQLLRYSSWDNLWTEIQKLPQNFKPSCLALWREYVVLCGSSASCRCYMLKLKNKAKSPEALSTEWVQLERREEFDGFALCSVPVEI